MGNKLGEVGTTFLRSLSSMLRSLDLTWQAVEITRLLSSNSDSETVNLEKLTQ